MMSAVGGPSKAELLGSAMWMAIRFVLEVWYVLIWAYTEIPYMRV
jgi:hypothetical protein